MKRILHRMNDDPTQTGIDALHSGNTREARRLLADVVRVEPDNVVAWWYLAEALDDPEQKVDCLRQVLRLKPDHRGAQQLLAELAPRLTTPTPPRGIQRPVLDATERDGKVQIAPKAEPPVKQSVDARRPLRVKGLVIAALIIPTLIGAAVLATVLIIPNVFEGQPTATAKPLAFEFGLPSCAASQDDSAKIVFVNESKVSIDLLRGPQDGEQYLVTLAPGEEKTIGTAAGLRIRYAARSDAAGYGTGGAILDIPESSVCRVSIQ